MIKKVFLFVSVLSLTIFANDKGNEFEHLLGKDLSEYAYLKSDRDIAALKKFKALYIQNVSEQFKTFGAHKIPKVVHFIWLGPKSFPIKSIRNVRKWIDTHPDWTFKFWTDRARIAPLPNMQVHFVKDFKFDFLESHYLESTNWGEKSDILRYEILRKEGGVYSDHDADCLQSFDPLNIAYDLYACLEVPHSGVDNRSLTAGIGIIGACKNHKVIDGCIQSIQDNWEIMSKRFPGTDSFTAARRVSHRSYIAMTNSLLKNVNQDGNTDIVFPAAYFYPKGNLKPIYSFHEYGTSWNDLMLTKKQSNALYQIKKIEKKEKQIMHLQKLGLLLLFLSVALAVAFIKRSKRIKKESIA